MLEQKNTKKQLIAGVDEAGRGPLAGPVVAAAVILDAANPIIGLADSKKLTAKRREALFEIITHSALAWATGRAEVEEIDRYNILQTTLLAMQRAIKTLQVSPELVLIDGNTCPDMAISMQAIVGGDDTVAEISAASIVAKVVRDREMLVYDTRYPGYGFAKHKGYGTKDHMQALQNLGITPIHRRSFAPVKNTIKLYGTVVA